MLQPILKGKDTFTVRNGKVCVLLYVSCGLVEVLLGVAHLSSNCNVELESYIVNIRLLHHNCLPMFHPCWASSKACPFELHGIAAHLARFYNCYYESFDGKLGHY